MLIGDFNLHHPLWGGTLLPTQHTLADNLIETTAHWTWLLQRQESQNRCCNANRARNWTRTPTIYRSSHQCPAQP
jgi:hypothetical protein